VASKIYSCVFYDSDPQPPRRIFTKCTLVVTPLAFCLCEWSIPSMEALLREYSRVAVNCQASAVTQRLRNTVLRCSFLWWSFAPQSNTCVTTLTVVTQALRCIVRLARHGSKRFKERLLGYDPDVGKTWKRPSVDRKRSTVFALATPNRQPELRAQRPGPARACAGKVFAWSFAKFPCYLSKSCFFPQSVVRSSYLHVMASVKRSLDRLVQQLPAMYNVNASC